MAITIPRPNIRIPPARRLLSPRLEMFPAPESKRMKTIALELSGLFQIQEAKKKH
jgi:hypothetical protein